MLVRARFPGHGLALCGAPDGCAEGVEQAAKAVLRDQPLGVAGGRLIASVCAVADLTGALHAES